MEFKLQLDFAQAKASIPNFKTRKKSLVQTHYAYDKTHYALEIKSGMNGVEYILVGVFARRFRVQTKKKPFELLSLF